jgi:uncharacterized membrane protein YraQ (UPF0718 family)
MVADLRSGLVLTAIEAWRQVVELGPYVVGGVIVAVLLGRLDLLRRLGNRLGHRGAWAMVGAACLGGASPLCTYGTLPLMVTLLRGGASLGPVAAFLVASSLLNPQVFILVAGGLGLRLALAQVVGVFLLSLVVGVLARRLKREAVLIKSGIASSASCPPPASHSSISEALNLIATVGLTFVVGVVLAALLRALVSPTWIATLLGAGHWHSVLLAAGVGVPFPTCCGGAVPLVAGLVGCGMSPGAALAFLLVGAATRPTALAALGTLVSRRALLAYAILVVAGATALGIGLDLAWGS